MTRDEGIGLLAATTCPTPARTVAVICPQERGYTTDHTHVTFLDGADIAGMLEEVGSAHPQVASFPFPRAVGKVFTYNETVVLADRAMSAPTRPTARAELTESLRLARRELKLVAASRRWPRRRSSAYAASEPRCASRSRLLADALAQLLAERYWAGQLRGLAGRLRPGGGDADERGRWPRSRPASCSTAAGTCASTRTPSGSGISPAVHYVRTGAAEGAEPGTGFDSERYLEEHPDAREVEPARRCCTDLRSRRAAERRP